MVSPNIPLSAFDLVPVAAGDDPSTALSHSLDLAAQLDGLGYHRLWYGEHHLNPGVIGYSPALLIALAAGVTQRIRLGSGAVLGGHRTPLSIAEEFGLLSARLPGRVDLGLGRAGLRSLDDAQAPAPAVSGGRDIDGVHIPAAPDLSSLFGSPRLALQRQLLNVPGAQPGTYEDFVTDLLELLTNTKQEQGQPVHGTAPQNQVHPEIWVLGSSAGVSSRIAGQRGLRFGANYHVAPAQVLEAVQDYRDHFVPSPERPAPWVIVSAEVLVADTEAEAQYLARGYDRWVHSIRSGQGAIPYPHPDDAAATEPLSAEDQALVADRVSTRFVGTAEQVSDKLSALQQLTGADELLISTITHDHQARLRSFALLADIWNHHTVSSQHTVPHALVS